VFSQHDAKTKNNGQKTTKQTTPQTKKTTCHCRKCK